VTGSGQSIDVIRFLSAPTLLGPHFAGPSWDRWRAVMRAAYALTMDDYDRQLFCEVSGGRAPPSHPVSELVCLIGRGGGKDSIAAALAVYIAVTSDFSRLRPGEKGCVLCLATDRDQAGIAFGYIKGLFEEVPMLAAMVERITADTIDLNNGAQIIVATNSFRAVRGRTICCVIMDEVCFWRSDDYADPDVEVDAAVGPGLARFPGSLKVLISSTYRRAGLAFGKWKASFGKDDDDTLVILGTTRQFNAGFPQKDIDRDIARDPDRYRAEYLSEWRDDLRAYIDREAIEACVTWGCYERAPRAGIRYRCFVDVSGGRGDSFCWAIGHLGSDGRYVVDLVREVIPPFSPDAATKECAADCRRYGISAVTGDNYGGEWPAERSRNHGINYERSLVVRSDIYKAFLPEVNAGRVDLIECDRGIVQFCQLERKVRRSGSDSIGHPQGAHDDVANVIAGCVWLLSQAAAPAAWSRDMLFVEV
jgi:hypothetical protein